MPPGFQLEGDSDPHWMPNGISLRVTDLVLPLDGALRGEL